MKILLVATSYPRFYDDASSVFLRYLARSFGEEGHNVHVMAPNDPQVNSSLSDKGVTIHRFGYFAAGSKRLAYGSGILPNLRAFPLLYLQIPFFLLSFFWSLFVLARRERPDVMHAHWIVPTGFVAVLVGWVLRIPVITTAHGGDAFSLRSPVLQRLKTFTLRNSAAWTANTHSTGVAAKQDSDIPEPVIIPMGVDVAAFAAGERIVHRAEMTEAGFVILFVGRLVAKKGCGVLVQAFKQVVTHCQEDVTLWIVGDGEDKPSIGALIEKLGLADKVKFYGGTPNERLPDIYAGADLFILPSVEDSSGDTEGQGVVLLEAMSSGTAIIASNVGGVGEVIENGVTGWLIVPSDPVVLGNKIAECLLSEKMRTVMAKQARLQVASYDWSVVSQSFITLFTRCVTEV